ncbi:acetyl-CoA synthetase-like protein [Coniochaeta ligniaria NRRL 30616]|uniref:Very long-chain fatty acid transport protein n=1 Tax=Coniochaeta ligniaria NRRL 30616 TaxID=1408157 RepID=A0A1J7I4X0_9PEZI|nr:acetyl-CoA synthetase-like protein [Coniochaeta ligniaria NRRL 30616]
MPAAAAGAAYLNARGSLFYDAQMLRAAAPSFLNMLWDQYRGRLNSFYRLETLATAKASADRPFLLFDDEKYTYSQAYDYVLRYGHWLKTQMGVNKGDIVALDFQNTAQFVFLFMAVWEIGAKPAFINYNLSGKALIHCLKRANTRLVLIDPNVAENVGEDVRQELPGVRFGVFGSELASDAAAADPVRYPDELRGAEKTEDMAILIYTSGTTGLPKAAVVSWGKVFMTGAFTSRLCATKTTDTYYIAMPLYHSTATLMGFGHVLQVGATLALGRKFSTSQFWHEVRKHQATIILYVGETCRYLLSAPPVLDPVTGENLDRQHRVHTAFGNGLRPDVWNKFKERFGIEKIVEFYGATEGNFATWNVSCNDFSVGAIGRNGWLYDVALKPAMGIVEVDHDTDLPKRDEKTGFCRRAASGEPGELLFALPPAEVEKRFQGYFGDNEATNKKVMRDVFKKGDAWFRTGDVVRWDSEGRMYFNDRIGDTFRWKSENVSTAEVAHILGLHPAVHEANVYGVQLPHHEGRAGCAAIILNPAITGPNGQPSSEVLKSMANHVQKELPKYALPLFLRVLKDQGMQTTGTNKQQKHHLREEGVDPQKTGEDAVFWLRNGTYQRFTTRDWAELNGGRVKL